jgi:hypothetical protein
MSEWNRVWTEAETERLQEMRARGLTHAVIAEVLGRSLFAVSRKARLLQLADRPSFRCGRCGEDRPTADFTPAMRAPGGYCRDCDRARRRVGARHR